MPLVLTGLEVDRHHRAGEQVVARTQRAVLRARAAARVAEAHVVHAELGVDRAVHPRRRTAFEVALGAVRQHRTPGGAGVDRVAVDVGEDDAAIRATEEVPDEAAVARVQREHRTTVAVVRVHIDHTVVVHGRDLFDPAQRGAVRGLRLDHPDLLAGVLVEGDDPIAISERVDLAVPDGDAAPRAVRTEVLGRPLPVGLTGLAVDGDHLTVGRVDVDDPVGHDRRRLLTDVVGRGLDGRDVRAPDRPEFVEVLLPDLRQRRVVLVAQVAADGRHVGSGRRAARVEGPHWCASAFAGSVPSSATATAETKADPTARAPPSKSDNDVRAFMLPPLASVQPSSPTTRSMLTTSQPGGER